MFITRGVLKGDVSVYIKGIGWGGVFRPIYRRLGAAARKGGRIHKTYFTRVRVFEKLGE